MVLLTFRLAPAQARLAAALTLVALGATSAPVQAQPQAQPQAQQQTQAQTPQAKAPTRPPAASADPQPPLNEPVVQHIIIEDDGTRIEELHVRGEAQRIQVQPKGLSKRFAYEVVPASGARDLSPGPGATSGVAGQRVWSVLSF